MYKESLKQLRELQAERKEAERIALRRAAWAGEKLAETAGPETSSRETASNENNIRKSGSESQPPPEPAALKPQSPSDNPPLDPAPTQERLLPTGS
jgi:hypothetical protein